jgi:DNA-binding NarL/FixJ family response regulator
MQKLLVIDDDPLFLAKLTLILRNRTNFFMVATIDLEQIPEILKDFIPDCVLLDYELGDRLSVVDVAASVRAFGLTSPIVLISQYDNKDIFADVSRAQKLLQLGVRLFLRKDRIDLVREIWLGAIAFVIEAEKYITNSSVFGQSLHTFGRSIAIEQQLIGKIKLATDRLDKLELKIKSDGKDILEEVHNIRRLLEYHTDDEMFSQELMQPKLLIESNSYLSPEQIKAGIEIFDRTDDLSNFLKCKVLEQKSQFIEENEAVSPFIAKLNILEEDARLSKIQIQFLSESFVSLAPNLSNLHKNVIASKLAALQYGSVVNG